MPSHAQTRSSFVGSPPGDGHRARWPLLVVLVAVVVIVAGFVIGQLVLPGQAEKRIRSQLEDAGVPATVKVSSFPAVKLLFDHIDSAEVRAGTARITSESVADLIAKAGPIDRLSVSAPRLQVSGLPLTHVTLEKRGGRLSAAATTTRSDLATLLPDGSTLGDVTRAGDGVALDGSISVLGATFSGPAHVNPRDGSLQLETPPLPVVGSQRLTVFGDPRVPISRLGVRSGATSLRFSLSGRLMKDAPAPLDE